MNIKLHAFVSPSGDPSEDFDGYKSRFGYAWWYWMPRVVHFEPDVCGGYSNPRVVRLIWLCFAIGLDIGKEGV